MQGTGAAAACITDTLTGLMWESSPSSTKYHWTDAVALSTAGGAVPASLCGYTDWRLPNINELRSLVNYGDSTSAADYLNNNGFSNVQTSYYWSSSVYAPAGSYYNWIVSFNDGSTTDDNYIDYVWPVRGGESEVTLPSTVAQVPKTGESSGTNGCGGVVGADCTVESGVAWPNPRFSMIITANGTCVTDNLTGLMWAQNANLFDAVSWSTAMSDVAAMNTNPAATGGYLCGYNDWRLPNMNELVSLVNYGQQDTSTWLNSQGFYSVQTGHYWSSSVYAPNGSGEYWVVYFDAEITTYDSNFASVWPVRGGGQ